MFLAGLRAVRRNWGLVVLVLAVNLALAAVLAVPLGVNLEQDLHETGSATNMLYGFDHDWWSRWSDRQPDTFLSSFAPDVFGQGFALKNFELLLRGHLPGRIFDHGQEGASKPLDATLLGVGALYVILQVFFTGGLLSVFRNPSGGWKLRGTLHASSFYFGRLFRLMLLGLLLYAAVFAMNAPLARWVDHRAYEAVSEITAFVWILGRHLLLFVALLGVFTLLSYAKTILVAEERLSSLLALVSALGLCLRQPRRVAVHVLLVLLSGALLLWLWSAFDAVWTTTGWKTQLVTLLGMQALMLGRIGLRLALLAGQMALCQNSATD